ncbi:MAG: hypothetical protein A3J74_10210 [Elusimicrobia bacterium RIFCSPHIGHO2_02_FULL_57_9]|nr:MAG: hypothetical protein A3J74_10210 [Elusimicrobia bacterium RIFCSPHIGHO2_02_FULL_57_9]
MGAAFLLFLWLCPLSAAEPPGFALLPEAALDLERLEQGLAKTWAGRRLLAQTQEVSRRSRPLNGELFAYQRLSTPTLFIDADQLNKLVRQASERLGLWEFELMLVRELAKAGLAIALEMPEVEMAAVQSQLEYALERAQGDAEFSQRLKDSLRLMRRRADAAAMHLVIASPLALTPLPQKEMDKAAFYLILFRRDEDEFYAAVERSRRWSVDAVRLTELEDFIELHGRQLQTLPQELKVPYVRINGRRYPTGLVRAARFLPSAGGLARLHEAFDFLETRRRMELKAKLKAWLGAEPAP